MGAITWLGTPRKTCIVSDPLWQALQSVNEPVTTAELSEACADASWDSRHVALSRWVERGAVIRHDGRPYRYLLHPDYRGRPNPDGRPPAVRERMRETTQQQRIWAAVRVLRTFDVPTLCMAAASARHATHQYVNTLRRAGYVDVVKPFDRFLARPATFRLARNTGPKCPTTHKVARETSAIQVRDNNTGRIVLLPPGEHISRRSPKRSEQQAALAGGGVG